MQNAHIVRPFRLCFTFLALAAALSACGGGGGGGPDSAATTQSITAVSGVAAKGLLAGAKVEAFSVNPQGEAASVLQTTLTASDGSYSLTGLSAGQLVLIKVSSVSGTTMKDEASAGGASAVSVPDGALVLRAVTVLNANGNTTAHVTPFSEMAYRSAKAQAVAGGFNATLVQNANAKVSAMLGLSILTDKPAFAADGAPTNAPAVKLAAVSQMARAGTAATTSCNANNGDEAQVVSSVKCVVDAMAQLGPSDPNVASALNAMLLLVDTSEVTDPAEKTKALAQVVAQP